MIEIVFFFFPPFSMGTQGHNPRRDGTLAVSSNEDGVDKEEENDQG